MKPIKIYMLPIMAAAFLGLNVTSYAEQDITPTITVTGTGKVQAEPDMASISFGVIREANTAREALDANSKAMAKVIKSMEESGIEKKDIQTSQFNIQPRYIYPKRNSNGAQEQPKIVGYSVSNNVTVIIRELEQAGSILDEVISLGVNSGGNINFSNSDTASILEKAREKAVKNAIKKAQTLSESANVELGDILNISENANRPIANNFARSRTVALEAASASVPIAAGEQTYTVNVQMQWEIDQ